MDVARLGRGVEELPSATSARIDDFIEGIVAPGQNERLQFARSVIERNAIDPDTVAGKGQLRRFLIDGVRRVPSELMRVSDALRVASRQGGTTASLVTRTAFRERGLSSDTSILIASAIERAHEAMRDLLPAGSVRRVGLVGPGLDRGSNDSSLGPCQGLNGKGHRGPEDGLKTKTNGQQATWVVLTTLGEMDEPNGRSRGRIVVDGTRLELATSALRTRRSPN